MIEPLTTEPGKKRKTVIAAGEDQIAVHDTAGLVDEVDAAADRALRAHHVAASDTLDEAEIVDDVSGSGESSLILKPDRRGAIVGAHNAVIRDDVAVAVDVDRLPARY
ncbi:hypothetical protein [Aureimonas altamirensis]|uniref:hypothetical protein n=1 Tax=Aureimonas altamirensis TaxID=370622 RepID=UPI00301606EA